MVAPDSVQGEARAVYEGFLNASKKVPKWVTVMANCPDILAGFFKMFKATMDDKPLPAVLKWKVAKQVSELNKCEFCIDVANSQLKQFGLSDEQVAAALESSDHREQAALAFAKAATEKAYAIDAGVIAEAKKTFTDEELVELTAVVGLFSYINRFNDALGVLPE